MEKFSDMIEQTSSVMAKKSLGERLLSVIRKKPGITIGVLCNKFRDTDQQKIIQELEILAERELVTYVKKGERKKTIAFFSNTEKKDV